jgi:hypothetical protein
MSAEEAREIYGKCDNPHGHGHHYHRHKYEVEITVRAMLGAFRTNKETRNEFLPPSTGSGPV